MKNNNTPQKIFSYMVDLILIRRFLLLIKIIDVWKSTLVVAKKHFGKSSNRVLLKPIKLTCTTMGVLMGIRILGYAVKTHAH